MKVKFGKIKLLDGKIIIKDEIDLGTVDISDCSFETISFCTNKNELKKVNRKTND